MNSGSSQRKLDRQRHISNPDNYNSNGTIRKVSVSAGNVQEGHIDTNNRIKDTSFVLVRRPEDVLQFDELLQYYLRTRGKTKSVGGIYRQIPQSAT